MEQETPSFTLSVINPCLVLGPVLTNDASTINTSTLYLLDYCSGKNTEIKKRSMMFVDVRDVAAAHLAAMELSDAEAVQGRFIVAEGVHSEEEMVNLARRHALPSWPITTNVATSEAAFSTAPPGHINRYSNTRSRDILGIKYRSFEETIRDSVASYADKGLLAC